MKEDNFKVKAKKETKVKAKVSGKAEIIKDVKIDECGGCAKKYGSLFCKSCIIYKRNK